MKFNLCYFTAASGYEPVQPSRDGVGLLIPEIVFIFAFETIKRSSNTVLALRIENNFIN